MVKDCSPHLDELFQVDLQKQGIAEFARDLAQGKRRVADLIIKFWLCKM